MMMTNSIMNFMYIDLQGESHFLFFLSLSRSSNDEFMTNLKAQ